jgi:hypothetical protein
VVTKILRIEPECEVFMLAPAIGAKRQYNYLARCCTLACTGAVDYLEPLIRRLPILAIFPEELPRNGHIE